MIVTNVSFDEEKNVFIVQLDDENTLYLTYDTCERYLIAVGAELSEGVISYLKLEDTYTRAKSAALSYISYRLRSRAEVDQNLQKKGFDQSIRKRVLNDLKNLHLLDDDAYAATFIKDKIQLSHYGPVRIRALLRERGVENFVIEDALSSVTEDVYRDAARKAVNKKNYTLQKFDKKKRKQKIFELLSYRGFPLAIIYEILEEQDV